MKLATGFRRAFFVLLTVFIFSPAHSVLWAKNKNIQFLPRNETVDIVSKDLGTTLHEVPCASAEDIFKQAALCSYCVDYLKADRNCPDCCLSINNPQKRFIHCTKDEDSDFPCKDIAFYPGSCSALPSQGCFDPLQKCNDPLPQCQQKGCPNLEPNQKDTPCIKDGNNAWFCKEDKLSPKSAGCVPDAKSGLQNCSALNPVYSKIEKKPCPDDASKDCFRYEIKSEALDCQQKCDAFGPLVEKCTQKLNCCRSTTCGDGFSNHCNTTLCQERLAWPECDKMTAQHCIELQASATNCLTDSSSGKCHGCFTPLADDFEYKFVAKSREKVIIIWQLTSTRTFSGSIGTEAYFYTMVKVTDQTTGNVVHESLVTQKSFQGSFSIFSATAVDADKNASEGRRVLETGKPYSVRVYYFIPPLNRGLNIQIDKAQMIIVRVRN